jgi:hypothetical protein
MRSSVHDSKRIARERLDGKNIDDMEWESSALGAHRLSSWSKSYSGCLYADAKQSAGAKLRPRVAFVSHPT